MNPYSYNSQNYNQQYTNESPLQNNYQQQYPYYSYQNYGYYQQQYSPQSYYQQYPSNQLQLTQTQSVKFPNFETKVTTYDPADQINIPDNESRWHQSLKIYAHLYRRLQISIPNVTSEQYCKKLTLYNEQSLLPVKNYVERAFNKCQSDQDRSNMESLVKQIISDAKKKNQYYTRDWLHYPIPTLVKETYLKQQPQIFQIQPNTMSLSNIKQSQSQNNNFVNISNLMPSTLYERVNLENTRKDTQFNFSNDAKTLYDVFKEKQIQTINLNNIRKKPMKFSLDQMYLESQKLQPGVTQRIQRVQLLKEEEYEDLNIDKKIIGACQDIEKPYYRLTGLPDPSIIRPERVLKKALNHFVNLWNEGDADYDYIVGQLRSIRQDLVIQHIQNSFAVKVYEENARICLDIGDFPRYESCWSMLCDLYEIVNISEGKSDIQNGKKVEFTSYRIVYLTMLNKQDQLVKTINELKEGTEENIFQLALEYLNKQYILSSLHDNYKCGNYAKFFKLFKKAPETMKCILNQFLARIRVRALKQFMKGFIGTLSLDLINELLAFDCKEQLRNFLKIFGKNLNVFK